MMYNCSPITSSAYHRMDMMRMRNRIGIICRNLRSIVKAHSAKHSNYVVLPKALVYSLLDELDAVATETAVKAECRGFSYANDKPPHCAVRRN